MSVERVLVIGTTSDYVEIIRRRFPRRALFVTSQAERDRAAEPLPEPDEELLCDLDRHEHAIDRLVAHIEQFDIAPSGVVCYDCESMSLAARIARELQLPYPSPDAVAACRSKYTSKRLWTEAGLPCPRAALVRSASDAVNFPQPSILKPLTGAGSELLFVCRNDGDARRAFTTMSERLASHHDARMYTCSSHAGESVDPRTVFAVEEFIEGEEYSCDFIYESGRAAIVRVAKKIYATDQSVGTTLAYILPAELPLPRDEFEKQIAAAARAVGLDRAVCMLDFICADGSAKMIEIAPRIGGDCLPPLILRSSGLDTIGLALDFAEQRELRIPPPSAWRKLAGLRFFATKSGVVRTLDDTALRHDKRVLEIFLKRSAGHRVIMPPDDYDSRLLGHVIFDPRDWNTLDDECVEINALLKVEIS